MTANTLLYVSMFSYLGALLLQRFLGEKNVRLLSLTQREMLAGIFSKFRKATLYGPMTIMALVFGAQTMVPGSFRLLLPIGVVAILLFTAVVQVMIYREAKKYDFPEPFFAGYRTQLMVVQFLNAVALVGIVVAVLMMRPANP